MVQLSTYLSPRHVVLDLGGDSKAELLQGAGRCLEALIDGLDAAEITDLLVARESLASTGVGSGIAIPHASSAALSEPCIAMFRTSGPVDFDSVDGEPVTLMLVVLAPKNAQALHLRILARVARLVRSTAVREQLLEIATPEQVCRYIGEVEGAL